MGEGDNRSWGWWRDGARLKRRQVLDLQRLLVWGDLEYKGKSLTVLSRWPQYRTVMEFEWTTFLFCSSLLSPSNILLVFRQASCLCRVRCKIWPEIFLRMILVNFSAPGDGELWGWGGPQVKTMDSRDPVLPQHLHTQACPQGLPLIFRSLASRCCVARFPPQEGPALGTGRQANTGAQTLGWADWRITLFLNSCVCEPHSPYNISLITLPTSAVLSITISPSRF